jgi:L-alanine-DL-glutamate epimerase-like enolase superfamily enzyme
MPRTCRGRFSTITGEPVNPSRRRFLKSSLLGSAAAGIAGAPAILASSPTDVRITDLNIGYEDFQYRTPLKFGGAIVDRVTLLNVNCVVTGRSGKSAKGFGSMPLGNVWSFPSKTMSYAQTLQAMKELATRIVAITAAAPEYGHPIDFNHRLEPEYLQAAADVSRDLKLSEPIPKLCTLVTASPVDASIHDAFGKLHGRNCYQTYGPEFMRHDLSHYLGPEFDGEYLSQYVMRTPKPRMPLYHLVGAVDPIEPVDIKARINDGLPETLPEWINHDGLTHMKIKLNGSDLKWDAERVLRVHAAASDTQEKRGVTKWVYSLDFNEKCPNVAYLVSFLHQIKEKSPSAFDRIQYVEQPTARDLKANRSNVMHEASKLRPVVIDESLVDLDSLKLAREMGYTGAALKACKTQSQAMLMAAAAQKWEMFLCVQDLTCPGASLVQSAGIAAHVPGVAAIEANARQYVPAANKAWLARFPTLFQPRNGSIETAVLNGPGLGAVA